MIILHDGRHSPGQDAVGPSGCLRKLLAIRVDRVDWNRPVQRDGENWYEVEGVEVTTDGREIGRRQALVRGRRLSALPRNTRS